MRQAAVINIEIGIEGCVAERVEGATQSFEPLAGLLLLRIGEQPRFEIADDVGVSIGNVGLLARVFSA